MLVDLGGGPTVDPVGVHDAAGASVGQQRQCCLSVEPTTPTSVIGRDIIEKLCGATYLEF